MKIKNFYFQNATYLASDEKGNAVMMNIDYKSNSFKVDVTGQEDKEVEVLVAEAKIAAKNLLKRKHGVNMIERLESSLRSEK